MWDDKPFRAELEALGESEVKAILARGDQWANLQNRVNVAQLWLREKEDARRDSREEKTLCIAMRANTIAIIAIVLATVTAIAAIIFQK